MNIERVKEQYIDLLLEALDLQAGQNLLIRAEPVHWDLCNRIAAAAYRLGANYVHVMSMHEGLRKARIDFAPDESLDYVPEFVPAQYREFADGSWAVLALAGPQDPDLLSEADPARSGRIGKANARAMQEFRERMQRDRFAWCVAGVPTPKWAAKVTGLPAGARAEERLWEIMVPILRLDRENPAEQWRSHAETLKARARTLTDMGLSSLHFRSGETDLRVGLLPESVWIGGGGEKPDGRPFLPNVPTEEVFTTPHRERTNGHAVVTRPVQVLGKIVEGAWFSFENGVVSDYGAKKGADILEQYFGIDEHANRLGEIALVDSTSPVFTSETVFYNILYDENAACHMALGSSYPGCVAGSEDLDNDAYVERGGNRSNLHTDFMIGTPDISVSAETASGDTVEIMREGRFVL
ncbi:MAG: aminopeptidase [Spirochaetales bacterium]